MAHGTYHLVPLENVYIFSLNILCTTHTFYKAMVEDSSFVKFWLLILTNFLQMASQFLENLKTTDVDPLHFLPHLDLWIRS